MGEHIYGDIVFDVGNGWKQVKREAECRERITRCRDCARCKPTTDDRRYCALWSHIVQPDGFCWRGEEEHGDE